jgi:hypothetical protein
MTVTTAAVGALSGVNPERPLQQLCPELSADSSPLADD